jgi:cobalt-zinc-cadmium resistance protein CzcA
MLKGSNSREVVKNVKAAIVDMSPYLPKGLSIDPYYDRAEFIDRVLQTIAKNLGEGALIVVVCLLLTLGGVRAGLLVAGAIPFCMLCGFIGLTAIGYSGNVMSLGAVDFGIIVEGAVVTIEHALTHGEGVIDRIKRREAIIHAIKDVTRPALFTVIIVILTFLPLATLEDVEGKMFRAIAPRSSASTTRRSPRSARRSPRRWWPPSASSLPPSPPAPAPRCSVRWPPWSSSACSSRWSCRCWLCRRCSS